ncbi:MAG: polyprenyl diphosphate synthase [Alphaproteobacteria bacterium]
MSQPLEKSQENLLPRHIAIIMDGNRRWAIEHNVSRLAGHKKGIEAARRCVEAALELGIENLTLYAFSSENWKRPKDEVDSLMGLLRLYVGSELKRMASSEVRLRFIGRRDNLPADIRELLAKAEAATRTNKKLLLTLAINYGSHGEILGAVKKLGRDIQSGRLDPETLTEQDLTLALETGEAPDPDMVIRTGGEKRLSNFLLWQSAYAELVFFDAYWPDFNADMLEAAIGEFKSRERRFGARR